jgi:hypothetical protein
VTAMALGDLSPDQARFVDTVAARTGLDDQVVTAWVGSESGWGTTKADHNYLNVGPGRQYGSVDVAAAAAARLVSESPDYAGIRSAIPGGGAAQVAAIGSSAWGTASSTLSDVWRQLSGNPGLSNVSLASNPLDTVKGLLGLDKVGEQIVVSGLTLVFVAAAFGLVALGMSKLTEKPAKQLFGDVAGVAGMATGTKTLATAAGAVA